MFIFHILPFQIIKKKIGQVVGAKIPHFVVCVGFKPERQ
jgi:hypothetical protein